jgi:hypothetical protein
MDGTQFSKHNKTIGLLNGDGDGPGFFLQVEGASIDKSALSIVASFVTGSGRIVSVNRRRVE